MKKSKVWAALLMSVLSVCIGYHMKLPLHAEDNSYTVTIPTAITYSAMNAGKVDQMTSYDVKVNGTLADDKAVQLNVDTNGGHLTAPGGELLELSVKKDKDTWAPDEVADGQSSNDTVTISGTAKAAGGYKGSIIYSTSLIENTKAYTVTFDSNGGDDLFPGKVSRTGGKNIGWGESIIVENGKLPTGQMGQDVPDKMTVKTIDEPESSNGKAVRIERTSTGTMRSGYGYIGLPYLTIGNSYTVSFMVKGSGNWWLGREQGGCITNFSPNPNKYTLFTFTFTAIDYSSYFNDDHKGIIFYDNTLAKGDYLQIYDVSVIKNGEGTELATASRKGYLFDGWWTEPSGGIQVTGNTKMPARDITLYAHWKPHTYIVKYNSNGGSGTMKESSFSYDFPVNLPANTFSRSGYEFLGWNTNKD